MDEQHQPFMHAALALARRAAERGEVPIGAVVVKDGRIVGEGHNAPVSGHDPTAHAEVMALRQAAQALGNYRLDGCTLYVTLEPCTMCAGAILHARLARVVYAVAEPRTGAAGSVIDPFAIERLNHQTEVVAAGALGEPGRQWARACEDMLRGFFRERRQQARQAELAAHPLRPDAVRTPAQAFEAWPDWQGGRHRRSQFASHLPALEGLRLHYLDGRGAVQQAGAGADWLLLHGHPGWCAGYARTLERLLLLPRTRRVVVPDLIGFGLSDKPKKAPFHEPERHARILAELARELDLRRVVIVGHGVGADLAAGVAARLQERVQGLWLLPQRGAWAGKPAPAGPAAATALGAPAGDQDEAQTGVDAAARVPCAAPPELLAQLARRPLAGIWPGRDAPGAPDARQALGALGMAPWPDKGHQAAFRALAGWYTADGRCQPARWSWLASPALTQASTPTARPASLQSESRSVSSSGPGGWPVLRGGLADPAEDGHAARADAGGAAAAAAAVAAAAAAVWSLPDAWLDEASLERAAAYFGV